MQASDWHVLLTEQKMVSNCPWLVFFQSTAILLGVVRCLQSVVLFRELALLLSSSGRFLYIASSQAQSRLGLNTDC
jgi:hypothetical protein